MPRIARVVVPGYPHHITQRGNRNMPVFFNNQDRKEYINFLCEHSLQAGLHFWAYCLMDNHVHFIAVPDHESSLARGIGEAHRNYTRMINFREGWRGHLWQERFKSYLMDERYLYAAVRYVELNPVRAGLVKKAEDYTWSSARAHVLTKKDKLLSDNFMLSEIENWSAYLTEGRDEKEYNQFQKHTHTGQPLGNKSFITKLEQITKKALKRRKPGPKGRN